MECVHCGRETSFFTVEDEAICSHCAETRGFPLCAELGKYVASSEFVCGHTCSDCEIKEREGSR